YKNSAVGSLAGINLPNDQGGNLATGTNLKLAAAASNGGWTASSFSLRPAADSPLIDKGSNPGGATFDQRGVSRVWGAAADIGAIEVPLTTNVLNANDSGAGSLRQAILDANRDTS